MSKTHRELWVAFTIVILFVGGIAGYLWSQQPTNLHVQTNIQKKPGHLIGVIPQFEPIKNNDLSYYKVVVETNQPHPDERMSYKTTKAPDMTPENAFWFENMDAPNDCAKITTKISAYGSNDQLIGEGDKFDCITGIKKFSQLSDDERRQLYPDAEAIDVKLRAYDRNDRNGVVVSWSHGPMKAADEYRVKTMGNNSDANAYVPGSNPKSIFLDIPIESNQSQCVENPIAVKALDENERILGFGYSSTCLQ